VQFALLPSLATEPDELVAANVGLATIEGFGGLLGPAVGGVLLAAFGPSWVLAGGGAIFLIAAVMIATIRVPVRFARRGVATHPLADALEGIRTIATSRDPRLVVGLFFAQTVVRGALGVFVVVASIELFELGEQGVGYLTAMIGLGGLLGAVVTLSLVGRPELARWFGLGLILWGAPLVILAGSGVAIAAYLAMALVGVGNNLTDVAGMTLLQRIVEDRLLTRVLGALDGIVLAGAAFGAAVAPALIDIAGARVAFAVVGLGLVGLVVLARPGLLRLDRVAVVPVGSVHLLRRVPMLAALDIPTIDHLAKVAVPMAVSAGTILIREGEHGDRFYVIADGSFDVSRAGRHLASLHEGDHVGEIALLRDVLRTATVTAIEDAHVLAVDRDHFLQAVTGFSMSLEEAHRVAEERVSQQD
jgi:predicted MFS family arabinose efflux permease